MDGLIQALCYAARTLRKSPGFALVAVRTRGLGIGATTAIFSVVKGVLPNPPPYEAPRRLVVGWVSDIPGAAQAGGVYTDAATPAAGTLSGDDTDPFDIDRIFSTQPDDGGNDTITTGAGDDIIIGGEDGEIVTDVAIDGVTTVAPFVTAGTTRIALSTANGVDPVAGAVWPLPVGGADFALTIGEAYGIFDPNTDETVSTPITTLGQVAGALATAINAPGTSLHATLVGASTVSKRDRRTGEGCLFERRAEEIIRTGEAETPVLKYGDTVKLEMRGADGAPLFGAIEQKVSAPA